MLRDLLHITIIKNFVEEIFNAWLTYATSQPVNFDLAVIVFFILQYTGVLYIRNACGKMVSLLR